MRHKPEIASEYFNKFLNPKTLKEFVKQSALVLKRYDFQGIAFRGVSGALSGPPLAFKMNKTVIVVRKPKHEETNHSSMPVEGDRAVKRYVIVDDFISSGATVREIVQRISEFAPDARCIGVIEGRRIIEYKEFEVTDVLDRLPLFFTDEDKKYIMHADDALKINYVTMKEGQQ
jgi:adenine/guanine phosphoribosyltransferase-like PRPP-binding protein